MNRRSPEANRQSLFQKPTGQRKIVNAHDDPPIGDKEALKHTMEPDPCLSKGSPAT